MLLYEQEKNKDADLKDVQDFELTRPELLYIKTYDQNDEWFSVPHSHPFVEIFYVLEGRGEFITQEKLLNVKKNDIIIINSELQHTERLIENQDFSYTVLGISNFSIFQTDHHWLNKEPLSFHDQYVLVFNPANTSGKLRQLLDVLAVESANHLPYSAQITRHYLLIFLYYIFQHIAPHTLMAEKSQHYKHLDYIKSYIDHHFSEDLSLDKLAIMVYMSKFHFSNEFKKRFAVTPIDYLLNLRIEQAGSLLKLSDYTMAEIAELSGFHSASYFSQIFKKKTGFTPSEYRRQYGR